MAMKTKALRAKTILRLGVEMNAVVSAGRVVEAVIGILGKRWRLNSIMIGPGGEYFVSIYSRGDI